MLTALPDDYDPEKVTPRTSRMTKDTKDENIDGPSIAHLYRVSYKTPHKAIVIIIYSNLAIAI